MSSSDDDTPRFEITPEYRAGFSSVLRELAWARSRGFEPTERQLTVAISESARIYTTARSGKPIGGRSPEWMRGRVDALRTVIRRGIAARSAPTQTQDDRETRN